MSRFTNQIQLQNSTLLRQHCVGLPNRRRSELQADPVDAQDQDDLANQLEHTGKGKNDAITKLFNAAGSVPAVKYHAKAAKYRAEAARLREGLAQLENQPQPTASVPTP
jgi:hypothetical protein